MSTIEIRRFFIYLIISILALMVIYPFFLVLLNSFKPELEIFTNFFGLPNEFRWENYRETWVEGRFSRYYINSIVTSSLSLFLSVFFSTLLAFTMSRKNCVFRKHLFYALVVGITIPPQVSATPLFFQVQRMGLESSLVGLILVFIAYRISFPSIIILSSFRSVPQELEEAALIDGARLSSIYSQIYIPLSKSIIAASLIFNFVYIWNNFFFPLLLISDNSLKTLPIGLLQFKGQFRNSFTNMFSGIMLISVPLITFYFALQKQFMKGIMSGAVKG